MRIFLLSNFQEEDGFELYESRAIGRVLALKYRDQGPDLIIDSSDKGYIQFEEALAVETARFDPAASALVFDLHTSR